MRRISPPSWWLVSPPSFWEAKSITPISFSGVMGLVDELCNCALYQQQPKSIHQQKKPRISSSAATRIYSTALETQNHLFSNNNPTRPHRSVTAAPQVKTHPHFVSGRRPDTPNPRNSSPPERKVFTSSPPSFTSVKDLSERRRCWRSERIDISLFGN